MVQLQVRIKHSDQMTLDTYAPFNLVDEQLIIFNIDPHNTPER